MHLNDSKKKTHCQNLAQIWFLACLGLLIFLSCGDNDATSRRAVPEGATMIVMGDSIMEWNIEEDASIPDVIGEKLDRTVYNAAISGAVLGDAESVLSIPNQYVTENWSWLILEGGANDFNNECGCDECGTVLDTIISEDSTSGILVNIASKALSEGARVMVVGYYEMPSDAKDGFEACNHWFEKQESRLRSLADTTERIWFVSMADVVTADNNETFDNDQLHPSIHGSRLAGEYIAKAILAAEASQ